MEKTAPFAKTAQRGILYTGIFVFIMLVFGARRQLVEQEYLTITQGTTAQTELIDIAKTSGASVEVVAQMQHTQSALFNTEILSEDGDLLSESSQEFSSSQSESSQTISLSTLSDADNIQVRLSVANQSVTATPPQGLTADQVPVIFEVSVYRQMLSRSYLWPAFWACVAMWIIVTLAQRQDQKKQTEWTR